MFECFWTKSDDDVVVIAAAADDDDDDDDERPVRIKAVFIAIVRRRYVLAPAGRECEHFHIEVASTSTSTTRREAIIVATTAGHTPVSQSS